MDFQFSSILGANTKSDIAVDNTLLIVGNSDLARDFANANSDKYKIKILPFISDYSGSLGDFCVNFGESSASFRESMIDSPLDLRESSVDSHESKTQTFAQIAFFSAFDKNKKPQLGVHFVSDYENNEALCDEIDALIGDFSFEKTILFDEKKCQYFHRDKTEFAYCKDCVAVCPTMAISANDTKRELIFSQVDCVLCGKCVAVCPSGAMNKANATLTNLNKALKYFKSKIAVVCESKGDFEKFIKNAESTTNSNANSSIVSEKSGLRSCERENRTDGSLTKRTTSLPDLSPQDEFANDFAPLILPSINLLNESYLISILQESGRICVLFGEIDSHLKECVEFINELYKRVVGQKAVFIAESAPISQDSANLQNVDCHEVVPTSRNDELSAESSHLPHYHYEISDNEFLRQTFANRVRFLTKERDFGMLENSANLIYTDLKINADKCTLCNACVESCNTRALINAKDSFTLLLNPSLCTACGYCVDTCAENCLEMSLKGYGLNESFLNYRVLAQDEPFKCVECGTIFATNKAINKVKSILSPAFMGDSTKLKSLECCEKCKVKIMFEKSTNFVGGAN
ncbi:4Fe-4S dicluster domain-containing protein [Helicobacter sp. 23-1044]